MHDDQVDRLGKSAKEFSNNYGAALTRQVEECSSLVLLWLDYLNLYQRTGTADELLDAFASAIRETSACLALGLVRPALFSMRTQIDLILSWIYFKDHPMEWRQVNNTGDGFKMKKELLDYLANYYDGFGSRYGILKQTSTRTAEDMYRLLSAHIHGQSNPVLPVTDNLSDVVRNEAICKETVLATGDLAEYISDILYATYAAECHAISKKIIDSIDSRFASDKQKKEFYATV